MQGESDLMQCPKCSAKVFPTVYEIHNIMCKPKKPKKKEGFFQSLFKSQKKEEQEAMIPCTECGDLIPFSMYAIHQQQCVGHQLTLCKACGIKFPTFLFEEHRNVCEGKLLGEEEEEEEQEEQSNQDNSKLEGMIQSVAINNLDAEVALTKEEVEALPIIKLEMEDECAICCTMMKKKQKNVQLNCSHIFHGRCIGAWLGKNPLCPMCRQHALQI